MAVDNHTLSRQGLASLSRIGWAGAADVLVAPIRAIATPPSRRPQRDFDGDGRRVVLVFVVAALRSLSQNRLPVLFLRAVATAVSISFVSLST
jgi:hypothetical protein